MDDHEYSVLIGRYRDGTYKPDARTKRGKEFLIRIVSVQAGRHSVGDDPFDQSGEPFSRDEIMHALKAKRWNPVDATFMLMGRD